MYVVVVGAGEVGTWVAGFLSREGHDVAVVERDPRRARELEAEMDVLVVEGSGTHPSALVDAGIHQAHLVVALTGSDEVNLLSALAARTVAGTPSVVRVSSAELRSPEAAALRLAIGVDTVLDPDAETALDIVELVDHPGAAEVDELAGGLLTVLGIHLDAPLPLTPDMVGERDVEPAGGAPLRVVAATRARRTWFPGAGEVLERGDLVRVMIPAGTYAAAAARLGCARTPVRRVLLLGGDAATEQVARAMLERRLEVVVVQPPDRADDMAERLERVLVLVADFDGGDDLDDLDLGRYDLVAALGARDEANVLACLLARSRGVPIAVAVVHRLGLYPLLAESGIFVATAARTDAANCVLQLVRGGAIQIATFLQGDAEVLEFDVAAGSAADGTTVGSLGLPAGAHVPALVRDGRLVFTVSATSLRAGDLVVLVTHGGPGTGSVRKLFE